jgi:DNA-binding NarL/FixJ family response regulator
MTNNVICLCGKQSRSTATKRDTGTCFPVLSQEEAKVLCLVARGGASSDIARELSVSEGAIRQHIKSLLCKARARSKPHLAMAPQEHVCSFETMMAL